MILTRTYTSSGRIPNFNPKTITAGTQDGISNCLNPTMNFYFTLSKRAPFGFDESVGKKHSREKDILFV